MIQGAFFGLFDFIAKNRWAQIALGVGVFYLLWQLNNAHQRKQGAKRYQRRAEKETRRAIETVERKLDEKSEQTARARADAPVVNAASELPDSLSWLIRD